MGVIGLSPGNGHPYSWSAIINGYEEERMRDCPFPSIPAYLAQQRWPEAKIRGAAVTHVHAPNRHTAKAIAQSASIPHVAKLKDLVHAVDAVLLARDDAMNHVRFAKEALNIGKPIYIDKPIALSRDGLMRLHGMQSHENQIFTCSALQFSPEFLRLRELPVESIMGIASFAPKDWDRYAMHAIEPVVSAIWPRIQGQRWSSDRVVRDGVATLAVHYEDGLDAEFSCSGRQDTPFRIEVESLEGTPTILVHRDTFSAFKVALESFLWGVRSGGSSTDFGMVSHCVSLLESGRPRG